MIWLGVGIIFIGLVTPVIMQFLAERRWERNGCPGFGTMYDYPPGSDERRKDG